MLGEDDEDLDDEDEDDGDAEWKDIGEHYTGTGAGGGGGSEVTPGDVFALEMELNRENKKMMNVRPACKNPSRHLLLLSRSTRNVSRLNRLRIDSRCVSLHPKVSFLPPSSKQKRCLLVYLIPSKY